MAKTTTKDSSFLKLQKIFEPSLHNWHKSRLNFLILFILAVNKVLSVNFVKLSRGFDSKSKQSSSLRRIQRFIADFELDFEQISLLLIKMLPIEGPFILTMDRTNWKFGAFNINILMLGICWQNISVPIFWMLLPKKGNSNTPERIIIIERFIRVIGIENISYLTADREFIGNKWFKYLQNKKIRFCIRVKENAQVKTRNGNKHIPISRFFSFLKNNQKHTNNRTQLIYGVNLWVSAVKRLDENRRSEIVIVVTNYKEENILESYAKRWQIECMFKAMKSSGYNIEDTHLTEIDRVKKLIALISITFLWAYIIGDWRNKELEPIKYKKHGRKAHSVFAYGLDYLSCCLLNRFRDLEACIILLSCT